MDGNRDDAERCLELAQAAFDAGDLLRCRRLYDKSVRMYARPPLRAAQDRLEQAIAAAEASSRTSTSAVDPGLKSQASNASLKHSEPADTRRITQEMRSVVAEVRKATPSGHYAVLGLNERATDVEIKRNFRKLALALHPDKNFAPGAEEAFKHVSRASEVLSDTSRRRAYDQFGIDSIEDISNGRSASSAGGTTSRNMRRRKFSSMAQQRFRAQAGGHRSVEEDLDELLSTMSPDELFEFLFTASSGMNPHAHERFAAPSFSNTTSVWTRYRPLGMLATVAVLLMLMSSTNNSDYRFSFEPTPSLTIRRVTSSGVEYYVSRFHKVDKSKPEYILEFDSVVDRSALKAYSTKCQHERLRLDELHQLSKSWLSRKGTREKYSDMAKQFKLHHCRLGEDLLERMRQSHKRADGSLPQIAA